MECVHREDEGGGQGEQQLALPTASLLPTPTRTQTPQGKAWHVNAGKMTCVSRWRPPGAFRLMLPPLGTLLPRQGVVGEVVKSAAHPPHTLTAPPPPPCQQPPRDHGKPRRLRRLPPAATALLPPHLSLIPVRRHGLPTRPHLHHLLPPALARGLLHCLCLAGGTCSLQGSVGGRRHGDVFPAHSALPHAVRPGLLRPRVPKHGPECLGH